MIILLERALRIHVRVILVVDYFGRSKVRGLLARIHKLIEEWGLGREAVDIIDHAQLVLVRAESCFALLATW